MALRDSCLALPVKFILSDPAIVRLAKHLEESDMEYGLFSLSDSEPVDVFEAHVLALAYDAAWRALHQCEPAGKHVIENLDLAIDFGPRVTH